MARIAVNSYMVRYPLGGNLLWALQWLVGFQQLGHEVYLVEKSGYSNSCFDVARRVMTDDPSYGIATLERLLRRFGLDDRWCYVDAAERYHGLSRSQVEGILKTVDVFLDMGTHGLDTTGTWLDEAAHAGIRVLVGTEPGRTQMRMEQKLANGEPLPEYDAYYTTGMNVGTEHSSAPTAGRHWRPTFDPVVLDLFSQEPTTPAGAFTTVMNWQPHEPLSFRGIAYGQKDVELRKFIDLPRRVSTPLEIAVAGLGVPVAELTGAGWRLRDALDVSVSLDAYQAYIRVSKGEFSVCKEVSVATNVGWFSERSGAYLASGRPVVMQETGFSRHLPCGRGLFAVRTVDEAAAAIAEIEGDPARHGRWARDVAREHLDARRVLARMLVELSV